MQNIISIIATNHEAISAPKNMAIKGEKNTNENTKDFVNILFEQIKNSIKISTKTGVKISSKVDASLDSLLKNDKKKTSSELLLNEVLSIISLLKGDSKNIKFPKFSDKLEKIINNKSVLNEFLNIKNISDITKLSKKYNLGLENIKFTKEEVQNLQKDFPKLNVKKFFEIKTDEKANLNAKDIPQTTKNKKTIIIEQIIKNLPKTDTKEAPKNILQTLLNTIDKPTKKVIIKSNEEDKKIKVDQFIKKDVKTGKITTDIKTKTADIKENLVKENPAEVKTANVKQNIRTTSVEVKVISIVETRKTKEDKIFEKKSDTQKNIKTDALKVNQNVDETILKDFKNRKIEKTINLDNTQNLSTNALSNDNSKKDSVAKHEPTIYTNEFKAQTKIEIPKTNKLLHVKESLSQFSNDLKEKIESYKPPLMKLQMALNPKNLGEVEVTLLTRGHNLHVNIVSNTNTMSFFTQNQAEFKNSLVNMGFTNLEMNFSDQGKGNQQNQNNQQNKNHSFEETQNNENYESTIELIVPKYV
jgi:hypothetical protein